MPRSRLGLPCRPKSSPRRAHTARRAMVDFPNRRSVWRSQRLFSRARITAVIEMPPPWLLEASMTTADSGLSTCIVHGTTALKPAVQWVAVTGKAPECKIYGCEGLEMLFNHVGRRQAPRKGPTVAMPNTPARIPRGPFFARRPGSDSIKNEGAGRRTLSSSVIRLCRSRKRILRPRTSPDQAWDPPPWRGSGTTDSRRLIRTASPLPGVRNGRHPAKNVHSVQRTKPVQKKLAQTAVNRRKTTPACRRPCKNT